MTISEELVKAAERCFNEPFERQWYGYSWVIPEADLMEKVCFEFFNDDDLFEGSKDGPWSVWFLLLCAEALRE